MISLVPIHYRPEHTLAEFRMNVMYMRTYVMAAPGTLCFILTAAQNGEINSRI